jgi:PBSX family phage terminase large subunit
VSQRIAIRGAVRELWEAYERLDPPKHALVEGPAGTGKTFGILLLIRRLCERHPGIRVLLNRKTRVSMSESTLKTWEEVLGPEHPAQRERRATRALRKEWRFPNGSVVVAGGMNNTASWFGSEYDLIYVNEAIELTEQEFESLFRSQRGRSGWPMRRAIILDTNPEADTHWLNLRASDPAAKMRRLYSRLGDNPAFASPAGELTQDGVDFLEGVTLLTGVMRERMLLGRWVAAEGICLDRFDRARHWIDREHAPVKFRQFVAGMDFGWRYPSAGTLQLYGVTGDQTAYLLAEHYQGDKSPAWWADRVRNWHERFGLSWVAADAAEPKIIDLINTELRRHDEPTGRLVRPAIKDVKAGVYLLNQLFDQDRLYLCRDSLVRPDERLRQLRRPLQVVDEIGSYVWETTRENRPVDERPDPGCIDHGIDAMRYMAMELYRRGYPTPAGVPKRAGSAAAAGIGGPRAA